MALFSKDRVLVPIDFSEASLLALKEALAFVESNANLHALNVISRREATEPGVVWDTLDDETRKQNVEKALHERLAGTDHEGMQFTVAIGDPSAEIIDYAKTHQIQLIVMPSRGRTGLERFFLGSVTDRVIRFAHCPVLVIRD
ncbi:universal stress protein [Romeria aff. gracilis LEGE 07310]|uniref:Universal stress protein n=1 Tax=Vasconcelosia minhoensis LEGE 07310 TaxID=915328 RepID=A0A8J7DM39_9CYAN|nr:universal stress protein [Romeria gracilis]MBE9078216.1 universal stress protein [Romeria aff. gracilis LEGE 07310]